MKSLCGKLNKNKVVYKISGNNFEECLKKAYASKYYNFYLNSELIDVNDRFRIFEHNNTVWLAKKSKQHKAVFEQKNAQKAKQKLDGAIINNKKVIVVEPILIQTQKDAFLLTQYYGQSLQECLYSTENLHFNLEDLKQLMHLLDINNMVFRGLLPRNIIATNNSIYLLDWEDVLFFNSHKETYLNLQFKTNFLLNWGYLFSEKDLLSIINKININKLEIEPELNKYEKVFADFNANIVQTKALRETILKTVLFAEKNICNHNFDFVIRPHDMAHLISDIFTYEIDVLFDLCLYNLRKNNEQLFLHYLAFLSNEIVNEYSKHHIDKFNLITFIILLLDLNLFKESLKSFKSFEDLIKFLKGHQNTLLNKFLCEALDLKEQLSRCLKELLLQVDTTFSLPQNFFNNVLNYLMTLNKDNFLNKVFENKYFVLEQNPQYKLFPRFYKLKLKPQYTIDETEVIDNLATMQKIIRETFASYNIKQVGIYAEHTEQEFCVLFIPYYQTVFKKLGIDPDNYQPYLDSYLTYCVEQDTIYKLNQDANKRLTKRIGKHG